MKIEKFVTGIISTNCYILSNEDTKEAVIVDPANLSRKMVSYMEEEQLKPKAILLTHAHFDHIMGIDKIIAMFGEIPVYVEENDLDLLQKAELNESTTYTAGYSYAGGEVIHDKDVLSLIGYEFQVIHTPGHTKGSCCYYSEEHQTLFSGDTIFMESVGRTDLPTGNERELIDSVRNRVLTLPSNVKIYPGHGPETNVAYEVANNPYA